MSTLPAWVSVVAAILVIAATLGSAIAVYKTNLQSASLAEARRVIGDLRGEISDYERQETKLKADIEKLELDRDSCARRITVLEDLVTRRKDDAAITERLQQLQQLMNDRVIATLNQLVRAVERIKQ